MKEAIERYNNWVYSRKKSTYAFIVIMACVLQTLALVFIPAVIDSNFNKISLKCALFFVVVMVFNFPVALWQYSKNQ